MSPAALALVILIPPASRTASAAAAHLERELDLPAEIEVVEPGETADLFARARRRRPAALLVLLDPLKNETWMSRPDDPELVVRRLRDPPPDSAYPLAIAAAELVRNAVAEREKEPEPSSELELVLSIGVGVTASPGVERSLAQPIFGADVRLDSGAFWTSAGLRARGPSSAGEESSATGAIVEYRRTDLAARIGFGPDFEPWRVAALLEAGISVVSARALRGAEELGSTSRLPVWIGLGVEVAHPIAQSLGAGVSVQLIRVLSPADFTGAGEVVFSEGDWRVQGAVVLEWAP